MTGLHGFASAPGARPAVLSAPVGRTLVLLGLLCGALAALWLLGSPSAQAAEGEDAALLGDAGLVETADRVDDALTDAGQEDAEAVREVSETVAPRTSDQVETALEPVTETVEPVHDTLDGTLEEVADEVGGHLDDTVAATGLVGTGQTAGTAPDQGQGHGSHRTAPADAPGTDAPVRTHEGPHVADDLPEAGATVTEAAVPDTTASAPSATDTAGSLAPANASAHTGAATGPACANFPSRVGLPAPAPGLDQAARHFLHAVPGAAADEPTLAPD